MHLFELTKFNQSGTGMSYNTHSPWACLITSSISLCAVDAPQEAAAELVRGYMEDPGMLQQASCTDVTTSPASGLEGSS